MVVAGVILIEAEAEADDAALVVVAVEEEGEKNPGCFEGVIGASFGETTGVYLGETGEDTAIGLGLGT